MPILMIPFSGLVEAVRPLYEETWLRIAEEYVEFMRLFLDRLEEELRAARTVLGHLPSL